MHVESVPMKGRIARKTSGGFGWELH